MFDLICNGKLAGVFQLEKSLRNIAIKLEPRSLEHLSALNAIGRPGPMDCGLVDLYIENKKNNTYKTGLGQKLNEALKPILGNTYGVYVYQEQVMKIAQVICGFSLAEADNLRKAIGKKKRDLIDEMKEKFISGAVNNGFDKKEIEDMWGYRNEETGKGNGIIGFADYCLAYDTLIQTTKGLLKIGDIVENKINCKVFSIDKNGFIYTQSVNQYHKRGIKEVFKYTLEDGSIIESTSNHKFLTTDGKMISIDEIFQKGYDILTLKTSRDIYETNTIQ